MALMLHVVFGHWKGLDAKNWKGLDAVQRNNETIVVNLWRDSTIVGVWTTSFMQWCSTITVEIGDSVLPLDINGQGAS